MRNTLLLWLDLSLVIAGCGGGTALGPKASEEEAAGLSGTRHQGKGDGRRLPWHHLFLIMMENQGTDAILGNTVDAPHINQLAQRGGVALQYFGVTHPSMPNYLAMLSGDFQGIWDDCRAGSDVTCAPEEFVPDADDGTVDLLLTPEEVESASHKRHWFDGRNLVDQLEEAHLTWKAYMQGLPAVGSTVESAPIDVVDGVEVSRALYSQRHNPFMYFTDVRKNPERLNRIVPSTQLSVDLRREDTTPNFVWLSPDNCHNMHGLPQQDAAAVGIPNCAASEGARAPQLRKQGSQNASQGVDHKVIAIGDTYVNSVVQEIMASPAWRVNSAIVVVWDEDDFSGHDGCCGSPMSQGRVLGGARAPVLVLTSQNARRRTVTRPANHYVMLATIQRLWSLGCLAHTCRFRDDELLTELFRD